MKKRLSALLALLLLTLSACTPTATVGPDAPIGPSPAPIASAMPVMTPSPTPAFEAEATPTIWGEQAMRTNYYAEDGTWLYELDVSYPLAGGVGAGYDAINSYYAEQLHATLTDPAFYPAAAQEEFEYYQEKYDGKSSPRLPFYLLTDHAVRYQTERLISIEIYSESYSGGAHPIHQSDSDCFDLDTGERLSLPDLFSDWAAARKYVLAEIQLQLKEHVTEGSYNDAAQRADKALDDTPFFLAENGLTIHYNEYAIASYVDGSFDFFIPYETLEDLLIQ